MRTIGLRGDYTAEAVRTSATGARDAAQARRLLSIAAVYDGMNRMDAAKIGGMDRQTLRDWVHRFNAEGPGQPQAGGSRAEADTGAKTGVGGAGRGRARPGDGWPRPLAADRSEAGDPGAVRRRLPRASRLLHDLGFSHMSARPQHPKQNARMMETFKKISRRRSRQRSRPCPLARP